MLISATTFVELFNSHCSVRMNKSFVLLLLHPVVPKPGRMGGYIPPITWLYPPNNLRMVHFSIPHNNLKGCTAERKFGEKSVLLMLKTFFFWSSPKIGEKKCSILGEDLFFLVFT